MSHLAAATERIDIRGEVPGEPATSVAWVVNRKPNNPATDVAGSPRVVARRRSGMDRYWFFTWRTYGTWLPGADGFVGSYRNPDRFIENNPGQPTAEAIPGLERYARSAMTGEPVLLSLDHAATLLNQFHETAAYRGWSIDAVAVMSKHVYIVFGWPGDPGLSELLKTWKSYASRALNGQVAESKSNAPRWFADGGSKRPLKAEANRIGAIGYVRDQVGPLLVWLSDEAAAMVRHLGPHPTTKRLSHKANNWGSSDVELV